MTEPHRINRAAKGAWSDLLAAIEMARAINMKIPCHVEAEYSCTVCPVYRACRGFAHLNGDDHPDVIS